MATNRLLADQFTQDGFIVVRGDQLRAAGLLANEPHDDLAIDSAWIPSPAYAPIARLLTQRGNPKP
jgi:hypothetical protein